MRRCRLRDLAIRFGLHRVDQVGELDAVLDEEHRHVVADEVEVAFVRVESHRETPDVSYGVGRDARACHGREAYEDRGRCGWIAQELRCGDVRHRLVHTERPVSACTPGVDDSFGDALMIEVHDLLAEVMILEQGRAATRAGP